MCGGTEIANSQKLIVVKALVQPVVGIAFMQLYSRVKHTSSIIHEQSSMRVASAIARGLEFHTNLIYLSFGSYGFCMKICNR